MALGTLGHPGPMGKSSVEAVMLYDLVYRLACFVFELLQVPINSLIIVLLVSRLQTGWEPFWGEALLTNKGKCSLSFSHFLN